MRKVFPLFTLLVLTISLFPTTHAFAATQPDVAKNQVTFSFPNTATFSADITGASEIKSVVLEYGNNQLTCGDVIAKAFPDFTPSSSVSVSWTWDMRQSGSLPPGATLWWRWRVTDANGNESVSDTKTATWLDNQHSWQITKQGNINFHWYSGDDAFAKDLINSAQGGLDLLKKDAGLTPDAPIDIYIYANTSDMKDAILYEPSWTGGEAFPEENIVILGISQSDLSWGRKAIVHELTHVLVGHLTFSCLSEVPTWLDEGLAVYSEGDLDPSSQAQLDQAIQSNQLLSVRSLSAGFSEVSDKANLSYSESFSIVKFLIASYGQGKMNSLLIALRDGSTIDEALTKTYGFDVDGLEDAWRSGIGADPRPAAAQPTAQVTPTYVPTYVPVSGAPLAVTPTPFAIPTSSINTPTSSPSGPPLSLTLTLLCLCLVMLLVVGVFIIGFMVRRKPSNGGKNE